jgi:asparagine synthase (glutamine-hydrolysing)
MLAGAWGARAGELLERAVDHRDTKVHKFGELTMLSAPDLLAGSWCCWMFGRPEDRGQLAASYRLELGQPIHGAFARALSALDEDAYELLCGRFVVVALDRERERCLIVRDQLGAQPLVHSHVGEGLLFAEHECDLLDLLPSTPSPDRLAVMQWISSGLTPQRHTLYEGIRRIPAGHRLVLAGRDVREERWWRIRYQGTDAGSEAALAEILREASFAAIGRAAEGSRRPAVKLSGGLDSACVAAGLAANDYADGHALALGGTFFDHPLADETELIEATARHTHLELELLAFDPAESMLAPALAHIARWRLPPATPNLFLWQPLMAQARKLGVDLVLDGEGGDELFGLAPYLIADMLRTGRVRTAWSLTGGIPGIGLDPKRHLRMLVLRRYGLKPLAPSAIRRQREQRAARSPNSMIGPADVQSLADLMEPSRQMRHDGPLWWRFQVESLIDDRDIINMAGHFRREAADDAVERRHPFLWDLRLIEAALRIPPRAQFDPVRDRPLLRDALAGLVPDGVRTRYAKSHFSSVVLAGIQGDESGLIEPLRRADAPVRGYVVAEALERRIATPPDQRSLFGAVSLWRLAIANRWLLNQAGSAPDQA